MIKRLWSKLTKHSQKVLETLMKNQFNIYLRNFNIGYHESEMRENPTVGRLSLKYVKPSIIESLYQEIDMFSCCIQLKEICDDFPPVPVDTNIQ